MASKVKVVAKGYYDGWDTFEAILQKAYDEGYQITHLAAEEKRVVAILEKEE